MDRDTLTFDTSMQPWLRRSWWVVAPAVLGAVLAVIVALPRQDPSPVPHPLAVCDDVETQERIPVCRRELDRLRQRQPVTFPVRGGPRFGMSPAQEDATRRMIAKAADGARRAYARDIQAWEVRVSADRSRRSFFWVPLTVGGGLSLGLWGLGRRRRRSRAREIVLTAHSLIVNGCPFALVELEHIGVVRAGRNRSQLRLEHVDTGVVEYSLPAFDAETERLERWIREVVPAAEERREERRALDAATREARRLQRARRA